MNDKILDEERSSEGISDDGSEAFQVLATHPDLSREKRGQG
jgi:hypothetical protein